MKLYIYECTPTDSLQPLAIDSTHAGEVDVGVILDQELDDVLVVSLDGSAEGVVPILETRTTTP